MNYIRYIIMLHLILFVTSREKTRTEAGEGTTVYPVAANYVSQVTCLMHISKHLKFNYPSIRSVYCLSY